MKKYIENLFLVLFALLVFTACSDEQGTDVGNDSQAKVTVYKYNAQLPLSADNDVVIRVAANNKIQEGYYFIEETESKNARGMSDDQYADFVIANGQKIEGVNGASNTDLVLTGIIGEVTITVVGVGGGNKSYSFITFKGLDWQDITDGTFTFAVNGIISRMGASVPATLQYCANEEGLYRIKDLYGEGYSLKIRDTGNTAKDATGEYKVLSIAAQPTPLVYGSYGAIGVRDVATWQNDESFLVNNKMYDDYNIVIRLQYFVDAGSIGYGYDKFIPAE